MLNNAMPPYKDGQKGGEKGWVIPHPGFLWTRGQVHLGPTANLYDLLCTGFAFKFEHRKWNIRRKGLHLTADSVDACLPGSTTVWLKCVFPL